MSWKTAYRSFYYANAEEPDDIKLDPETTALLVIDIQNTYLADKDTPEETARWQPFYKRMRETVSRQKVMVELYPKSKISSAFEDLAESLTAMIQNVQAKGTQQFFWQRLLSFGQGE